MSNISDAQFNEQFNEQLKDIGLFRPNHFKCKYKVIDEQKFFLAVVKYGLEYEIQ